MELKSLVGEVLSHVDESDGDLLLTTQSGRQIRFYHDQECCESVYIEDQDGEWHELIGKVLTNVSESSDFSDDDLDCVQKTEFAFTADDTTVVSKWHGESNGYYSTDVSIREIVKRK